MKRLNVETGVGIFLIVGFLCFVYLAVKLGNIGFFGEDEYTLAARFGSVGGLKNGAIVQIAGVKVGQVKSISLDQEYYEALVHMSIDSDVKIQEDSIASIRSTGIIGEKYVSISPGGSPETLPPGGTIAETESALSIEELVSKYIFQGE